MARGKLAQAIAYGARIMLIDGNFDNALKLVRSLAEKHPIVLVNSRPGARECTRRFCTRSCGAGSMAAEECLSAHASRLRFAA